MEFLEQLNTFQSVLFYIAIPTTVVYLLMVVMTFAGMDGADGVEADFDGDLELEVDDVDDVDGDETGGGTFQLFTLKNMLAFLIGLGWGWIGIHRLWLFIDFGYSQTMAIIYGSLCGVGFMAIQSSIFYLMYKVEQPGIMSNNSAVGKTANVYLTIPKEGNGQGKITVNVNGASKTLNAITKQKEPIKTGSSIKVTGIENDVALVELNK